MAGRQRSLFDIGPQEAAPWEADDASLQLVASVVLSKGPTRPFDYLVPDHLRKDIHVGCRVEVPFGRADRPRVGYCIDLVTRHTHGRRLKVVRAVIDRLLSPSMLHLTKKIATYYIAGWGQVLETVVPAAVRGRAGTRQATVLRLAEEARVAIDALNLPAKQAEVVRVLADASEPLTGRELARKAGCTLAPITTLRRKGIVCAESRRIQQFRMNEVPVSRTESLRLNDEQRRALAAIRGVMESRRHRTILIHGVTGSGKTEVYMQAIETVVGYGRQAIVLVPEISLTPQTRERFCGRFGSVAVLHSNLTDSQRHWYWQEIADGRVSVVVGARSGVFAPTRHLGLIVLDEEHESSFKQDSAPRYHARDVARWRAEAEGVPLVLGSATPSMESWYQVQQGNYEVVPMPRRVENRPLPDVVLVDLREELRGGYSRGAISRRLHQATDDALRRGGQVILLLNRRGFSTHIQCPACGEVVRCPHCDIAVTHHHAHEQARCHYCDYRIAAPTACRSCGSDALRYGGLGTQRLEAEVRARFHPYRCLRMDSDSMAGHARHEKALDAFRRGDVRILLGTQMIAKGLDFPNVTLVGVVNADTALHLPDFRAAERTFQLVTQVAGRTGRGARGGRVLVQTFDPEHAALQAAARHDYRRFAQRELVVRRDHGYPPYTRMMRIIVRGPSQPAVVGFAEHLAHRVQHEAKRVPGFVRIVGPTPAPMSKIAGKFRLQIQIQAEDGRQMREAAGDAIRDLQPPDNVQWTIDVDPWEMM